MPQTNKIIEEILKKVVSSQIEPIQNSLAILERRVLATEKNLENKMDNLEGNLGTKLDRLIGDVSDFAGKVQKFDEEQTVLSSHSSQHSDLIDKLHLKVFGTPAFA